MGVEIQNDTVAQNRRRDGVYIFDGEMQASLHEGENLAALHQRLGAPRRAPIADKFIRKFVRFGLAGLRRHHQIDGVILHVRRDQNVVAHFAQSQNFLAR